MKQFVLADYVQDIELCGLKGRMLNVPARTQKAQSVNILMFHGHHSSLERLSGIAEVLSEYANVCIPDMPGFGGMTPLYSVGLKPSIDNIADYMASFIKLHYTKKKKFVAVGYSFGFLVLTRMLQKYPELRAQIVDVVSFAGFVHHSAFMFSKRRKLFYSILAGSMRYRVVSFIAREVFMRKWFIATFYTRTRNARVKYEGMSKKELKELIHFEVGLWRCNDVRTRGYTVLEMFRADLLSGGQINKGLINVSVGEDHYFNGPLTEQQLSVIYEKVKTIELNDQRHSVSVVANAEQARSFIPKKVLQHIKSLQ